jgi:phage tail-like protein
MGRSALVAAVAVAWLLFAMTAPRLEASGITHAVHLNSLASPIHFQEALGLEPDQLFVEQRHGTRSPFSSIPMPGFVTHGKVMLRTGMLHDKSGFLRWYDELRTNASARETITIRLLDERGVALMTWELLDAWPSQVKVVDAATGDGSASIEYLELTHRGLSLVDNLENFVAVGGSVLHGPERGATVDFKDRQG